MSQQFFSFDEAAVQGAIEAAQSIQGVVPLGKSQDSASLEKHYGAGTLAILAQCISITVQNGQACLNVPVFGNVCIPVPPNISNGATGQACLHVCSTFGFPTGVRVSVYVNGGLVSEQSFGKC